MARIVGIRRLGVSLTLVGLTLFGLSAPVGASAVPAPGADVGTTLPPGWELCVLEGTGASVTQDNVVNIDRWQVAEGGSTNNSAAYNPFNTHRTTDANNNASAWRHHVGRLPCFCGLGLRLHGHGGDPAPAQYGPYRVSPQIRDRVFSEGLSP